MEMRVARPHKLVINPILCYDLHVNFYFLFFSCINSLNLHYWSLSSVAPDGFPLHMPTCSRHTPCNFPSDSRYVTKAVPCQNSCASPHLFHFRPLLLHRSLSNTRRPAFSYWFALAQVLALLRRWLRRFSGHFLWLRYDLFS